MKFLPKKIVGIDLHDYSAQLVELKLVNNKIFLEAYNRILIPFDIIRNGEVNIKKENEFKAMVLDFLQKANPKSVTSKNMAVVFPATKTFTHIFKFPASLNESEIKKAIPYEAETIIPFPIQDVYWDFSVLRKEEEVQKHASQYVLFCAIPKDFADQYARLFESMGLNPSLFGINVDSLKWALLQQVDPLKPTLIIELGALCTNYLILKNEVVHYFFSSNEGGGKIVKTLARECEIDENSVIQKWDQGKLNTKAFLPLIQNSIQKDYKLALNIIRENEADKELGHIQDILLTGEFLNLPDVYELAHTTFPEQKVSIGDPKGKVCIDAEKFLPLHKKQGGPIPFSTYFTSALGIGLRALHSGGGNGGINLLPDRLKESFSNRKQAFLIAISSVLMCMFSLFLATFSFLIYQNSLYERLNLEIKKSAVEKLIYGTRYGEIRDAINEFNNEVITLKNIDGSLFSTPLMLKVFNEQIPGGITLTLFKFNDSDLSIEMAGIADTRDALLQLQQNYQMAPFVSDVIAPISNYDEKSQISFILKITLNFAELAPYAADLSS